MTNNEWLSMFPSSETEFVVFGESDHRPLVSYISDKTKERRGMFIYDSRLTNKEGFRESVLRGFSRVKNTFLLNRISQSKKQIPIWKKETSWKANFYWFINSGDKK